jgi:hypothetical protein
VVSNIESLMSPEEIADLYGGNWSQHPRFPVSDWQYEVTNDTTRLGYWDWVVAKIEEDQHEQASHPI